MQQIPICATSLIEEEWENVLLPVPMSRRTVLNKMSQRSEVDRLFYNK
jgi:hypothetical protein